MTDSHKADTTTTAGALPGNEILSVREAVAYMNEHYRYSNESDLMSERHTRRLLSDGTWPCTRTSSGHLGIAVDDLRTRWESPHLSAS